MSGAVKIFTLNTALWDMSSRESERSERRRRAVVSSLPSFLPSFHFFSLSLSVVASSSPASHQIKWVSITHQHNTLEGRKREDLGCERDRWGGRAEVRQSAKRKKER